MALFGDWQLIKRWLKNAITGMDHARTSIINSMASKAADQIRTRIEQQRIEGPILSVRTIKRKGHSLRLIRTGGYKQSFAVQQIGTDFVIIGPSVDYEMLSVIHEYGTSKIPARPHIRPAVRDMYGIIPTIIKAAGFKLVVPTR